MAVQEHFPDFVKAGNQGVNPDLYEVENNALDRENVVWHALKDLASWDGKEILDLGCGSGFWLPRYAETAVAVVGVEPDVVLLPAARSRTEHARVLYGSAEHIPLPDASVDVIHARFAYFFPTATNDCSPGLAEVLRVLRPGGSLVVIDNDHHHGEFAELLARSPGAAEAQGVDEFIREWWVQRGATRMEVMSSWTFDSNEDLSSVLRMEFPGEVADPWLQSHPGRTSLSYGYLLYQVTKP